MDLPFRGEQCRDFILWTDDLGCTGRPSRGQTDVVLHPRSHSFRPQSAGLLPVEQGTRRQGQCFGLTAHLTLSR